MKGSFYASASLDGKWAAAPEIFGTSLMLWEKDLAQKNGHARKTAIGITGSERTSFSQDGRVLVGIAPKKQDLQIWRLAADAKKTGAPTLVKTGGEIDAFAISPDGSKAAVLLKDKDSPVVVSLGRPE